MESINDYIKEIKKDLLGTIGKPYIDKLSKEGVATIFKLIIKEKLNSSRVNVEIKGQKTYETNLGKQKFLLVEVTAAEESYDGLDIMPNICENTYKFLLSNYELIQYEIAKPETTQSKVNYHEPQYAGVFRQEEVLRPNAKKIKVIVSGKRLFRNEQILDIQKTLFFAQDGYKQDWRKYNLAKENLRHEAMKGSYDNQKEHECHNINSTAIHKYESISAFPIQFGEILLAEEKSFE